MSGVWYFLGGAFLGGLLSTLLLCALQLHRMNKYEAEIQKLRRQLRR